MRRARIHLMLFLVLLAANPSLAAEHLVSSASQIAAAMANANPGDTLIMTDGVWNNQHIDFAGFGTADNPITLKAQTQGGVILTGSSNLDISGRHLVVDGLTFQDGTPQGSHIVRFTGPLGKASNSRLTNTTITNYNPSDINDRYFWVSLYGQDNRVDHSRFQGQNHSGVTVVAWLDNNIEARHLIDNNHFLDRPEGNDNGFETIRLGTSEVSNTNAKIIVEHNLFERVDGEIEIISNKSNDNTFRYNTFRDSKGTLTLRHGHRATVEGNFFLGNNKDGSGGIRVIGEDHVITNNYFADLDDRADGVISITAGIPNTEPSGYQQVKNAIIAHNTIVSADMPGITFDWGFGDRDRTLLAENLTIAGNLITGVSDSIFEGQEGPGWTWQDNLVFGAPLGITPRPGITIADPDLILAPDGLFRPDTNSPALNMIPFSSAIVTTDMDGQTRTGLIDIGADEALSTPFLIRPLTAADVGPIQPLVGDFDASGSLDFSDIQLIQQAMATSDPAFDLNNSGIVDITDLNLWLTDLYGTLPGDANLDRAVNLIDLSALAASFGQSIINGYAQGDLNLDFAVNLIDLSILATSFGQSPTVPEPTTSPLLLLLLTLRR
ncbi:MAG: chondroitinase-B domain-containing protein [Phycisphaeraceae bacterium]